MTEMKRFEPIIGRWNTRGRSLDDSGIEIAGTDTYPMRAFDTQGGLTTMTASVADDGVWTFAGESERATRTVADDGATMRADWERTDDGVTWVPWLEMRFTRAS